MTTENSQKVIDEIKERFKTLPKWEQEYILTRRYTITQESKGDPQ